MTTIRPFDMGINDTTVRKFLLFRSIKYQSSPYHGANLKEKFPKILHTLHTYIGTSIIDISLMYMAHSSRL